MKSLKDSQPPDVFLRKFSEGTWNVVMSILINRMVRDDDAFRVGEIYVFEH